MACILALYRLYEPSDLDPASEYSFSFHTHLRFVGSSSVLVHEYDVLFLEVSPLGPPYDDIVFEYVSGTETSTKRNIQNELPIFSFGWIIFHLASFGSMIPPPRHCFRCWMRCRLVFMSIHRASKKTPFADRSSQWIIRRKSNIAAL
jgi:hypothetical protein